MLYVLKTKRALSWRIKSPPGGESCHSKLPFLRKNPFSTYNQFFTRDNPRASSVEGQPSETQHYCISLIFHYFGKLKNPFNSAAADRHTSDLPQPKSDSRELTSHWMQRWVEGGGADWFSSCRSTASQGETSSPKAGVLPFLGLHIVNYNNWKL